MGVVVREAVGGCGGFGAGARGRKRLVEVVRRSCCGLGVVGAQCRSCSCRRMGLEWRSSGLGVGCSGLIGSIGRSAASFVGRKGRRRCRSFGTVAVEVEDSTSRKSLVWALERSSLGLGAVASKSLGDVGFAALVVVEVQACCSLLRSRSNCYGCVPRELGLKMSLLTSAPLAPVQRAYGRGGKLVCASGDNHPLV